MAYSAYTYGYRDEDRETYMLEIDFAYTIDGISNGYTHLSFIDSSIYTTDAVPCNAYDDDGNVSEYAYEWRIFDKNRNPIPFGTDDNGEYVYTNHNPSCSISIALTPSIIVSYRIHNVYGTSSLRRVLYFNTYPTINAILARTSTAINKDEDSNNYKLLSLDADEYDALYSIIKDVMKSGYVKYAAGISLDYLAEAWEIYREDNETDNSLRDRLIQTIASQDSAITKEHLIELISVMFNIPKSDVELVERDDIPDYTFYDEESGQSRGLDISDDMGPYCYKDDFPSAGLKARPAEFTFFIHSGPNRQVQMSYINDLIWKTRAAGVYFNTVKVTLITEYELNIDISKFEMYDEIIVGAGAEWGIAPWGTIGERWIHSAFSANCTFDTEGKYYVTCSTNGIIGSNDGYYRTYIDVINESAKTWGYGLWGHLWSGDDETTFRGLKFTALENGATVGYTVTGTVDTTGLQYSTDKGRTWHAWDGSTLTMASSADSICVQNSKSVLSTSYSDYLTFNITGRTVARGVCDSLINYQAITPYCYYRLFNGCSTLEETPMLNAIDMKESCYEEMFAGCTSLTDMVELPAYILAKKCYAGIFKGCTGITTLYPLSASTMAESCYANMFEGCTGIVNTPTLSSTILAKQCYENMFKGCTSITSAPRLPASELAEKSYNYMFTGCTSLVHIPSLGAQTLAKRCYQGMFSGCTSLTSIPSLTATTLQEGCYQNMFEGCTSIVYIPDLNATTLASSCYKEMFKGCTSIVHPMERLPSTSGADGCYYGMFKNCTSLVESPSVSLTARVQRAMRDMFNGCSSLSSITIAYEGEFGAVEDNMFTNWVSNVAAQGDIYYNGTDVTRGVSAIPSGWQVISGKSYLTFTADTAGSSIGYTVTGTVATSEIKYSTDGRVTWNSWDGTSISLPNAGNYVCVMNTNNTLSNANGTLTFVINGKVSASGDIMSLVNFESVTPYCFTKLFENCTGLTDVPTLTADTVDIYCYASMFAGCTSIKNVPDLPAMIMAEGCYEYMFDGCISLTHTKVLPSITLAPYCYRNMYNNCIGLFDTLNVLPATILSTGCYYEMFAGCSNISTTPVLPATLMKTDCYHGMFKNCVQLMYGPEMNASVMAEGCWEKMFYGCNMLYSVKIAYDGGFSNTFSNYWLHDTAENGLIYYNGVDVPSSATYGIPSTWTVVRY